MWFDLKAKSVEETDFFVKKNVKLWKILENQDMYFNVEELKKTTPPDDIKERQKYEAKNGEIVHYDFERNNVIDEVEILEYYGIYDISDDPDKSNYKPIVISFANREKLIRS